MARWRCIALSLISKIRKAAYIRILRATNLADVLYCVLARVALETPLLSNFVSSKYHDVIRAGRGLDLCSQSFATGLAKGGPKQYGADLWEIHRNGPT